MKKLIYGIAFLAITGGAILVACNKQEVNPKTVKTEQAQSVEKLGGLSDIQLIAIINGSNPSYSTIEDIEDVLLDNCKLSSSVLQTLASNLRFPNYVVEEMAILSAPISDADLSYLNSARPSLSTTAIVAAASISDLQNLQFSIVNTSPRQMLFAHDIKKKSLCPDGCGASEIGGANLLVLGLTSTTTPLDPAEMKPCQSSTGKWTCGTAKEVRTVRTDGTTVTVQLTCTQSAEKCYRNPVVR